MVSSSEPIECLPILFCARIRHVRMRHRDAVLFELTLDSKISAVGERRKRRKRKPQHVGRDFLLPRIHLHAL